MLNLIHATRYLSPLGRPSWADQSSGHLITARLMLMLTLMPMPLPTIMLMFKAAILSCSSPPGRPSWASISLSSSEPLSPSSPPRSGCWNNFLAFPSLLYRIHWQWLPVKGMHMREKFLGLLLGRQRVRSANSKLRILNWEVERFPKVKLKLLLGGRHFHCPDRFSRHQRRIFANFSSPFPPQWSPRFFSPIILIPPSFLLFSPQQSFLFNPCPS